MTVLTTVQATNLKNALGKSIGYLDDAVGNYGEKAGSNPDNLPTLGIYAARAQGQREVLSEVQAALTEMLDEGYLLDEAILFRVAIGTVTRGVDHQLKTAQREGHANGLQETVRLIDRARTT